MLATCIVCVSVDGVGVSQHQLCDRCLKLQTSDMIVSYGKHLRENTYSVILFGGFSNRVLANMSLKKIKKNK